MIEAKREKLTLEFIHKNNGNHCIGTTGPALSHYGEDIRSKKGRNEPSANLEVTGSGLKQFEVVPESGYISLKVNGVEVARMYDVGRVLDG